MTASTTVSHTMIGCAKRLCTTARSHWAHTVSLPYCLLVRARSCCVRCSVSPCTQNGSFVYGSFVCSHRRSCVYLKGSLGNIGNKPLHTLLETFSRLGRARLQMPHSIPDVDQAHRVRNLRFGDAKTTLTTACIVRGRTFAPFLGTLCPRKTMVYSMNDVSK